MWEMLQFYIALHEHTLSNCVYYFYSFDMFSALLRIYLYDTTSRLILMQLQSTHRYSIQKEFYTEY